MTVPSPYAWTDDEVITASILNTNLRDPQSWLLGVPTFVAWNTSATNIANATTVFIPLNDEYRKVGFTHSTNDTKVYATNPGWYRWVAQVAYATNPSANVGGRAVWAARNGTTSPGGSWTGHLDNTSSNIVIGCRTGFVYLNGTTDYVELAAYQTAGLTATTAVSPVSDGIHSGLALIWQGRDS